MDAREPDHEIVTQAPDGIVGAPRIDRGELPIGKIGELNDTKMADERLVYLDLLIVHALWHPVQGSWQALATRAVGASAAIAQPRDDILSAGAFASRGI